MIVEAYSFRGFAENSSQVVDFALGEPVYFHFLGYIFTAGNNVPPQFIYREYDTLPTSIICHNFAHVIITLLS